MLQFNFKNISFKGINLAEGFSKLKENLLSDEIGIAGTQEYSILEMINKAKEEWLDAKRYFEEVTEPELIDHAIYRIEAAEKKYVYLLRVSQDESIVNKDIPIN